MPQAVPGILYGGSGTVGWDLDILFERTILAMRDCEDSVAREMENA